MYPGKDNSERYWYSFWGGPKFASGWAFGGTPKAALRSAIEDAKRWDRIPPGRYRVSLQDVTPANYFDFEVKVVYSQHAQRYKKRRLY